jgi:carbon-monoxide dehydrogenase medium subunit
MPSDEPGFAAPTTVEQAVAELGAPDAVAVSGGTTVGLLIAQDLLAPAKVVWLGRIPELADIRRHGDRLVVGAAVTLRRLAEDPVVAAELPAVAAAAAAVGNTRIRAVATVGGALAHADPRQDLPPALMAHGADVEVAGRHGRRQVPLRELSTGFMSTTLEPDDVITAISVPLVAGQRSRYNRFTPGSVDDYPTVAVAATAVVDGDGMVTGATVAVGGAGAAPYLVAEADALAGRRPGADDVDAVARAAAGRARPVDDRLGSAAYKREMVGVWTRRTLASCLDASPNGGGPTTGRPARRDGETPHRQGFS